MKRYITLLDEGAGIQMMLPVTPVGRAMVYQSAWPLQVGLPRVTALPAPTLASGKVSVTVPVTVSPDTRPWVTFSFTRTVSDWSYSLVTAPSTWAVTFFFPRSMAAVPLAVSAPKV